MAEAFLACVLEVEPRFEGEPRLEPPMPLEDAFAALPLELLFDPDPLVLPADARDAGELAELLAALFEPGEDGVRTAALGGCGATGITKLSATRNHSLRPDAL